MKQTTCLGSNRSSSAFVPKSLRVVRWYLDSRTKG